MKLNSVKFKFIALFIFLFINNVWAATKYVSPDGAAAWADCGTSVTPCSIATAQTNAAAGDVIIMATGEYSAGINTATAGTAGNLITWRSATPWGAVLNGYASGNTDRVFLADTNYNRFEGLDIRVQAGAGSTTYGVFSSGTGNEFVNNRISYQGDPADVSTVNVICLIARALATITDNSIEHCTYGVYLFAPTAGHASQVLRNDVRNMDVGLEENSDCFALSGNASYSFAGGLISDNDCTGYRDDGFDAFTQDDIEVSDNRFWGPLNNDKDNSSCLKMGYETSSGTKAYRNACMGLGVNGSDYGMVITGASSTLSVGNIFSGRGDTCVEVAQRNSAGGADNVLYNNACAGFTVHGLRVSTGATGTITANNVWDGNTGDVNVASGLTVTGTTNNHANSLVTGAGTYTENGSVNANPRFLGGDTPTTAEGFKLISSSPLCNTGTYVDKIKDYWNRGVDILAPSIGAMDCNAEYNLDTSTTRTEILTRE